MVKPKYQLALIRRSDDPDMVGRHLWVESLPPENKSILNASCTRYLPAHDIYHTALYHDKFNKHGGISSNDVELIAYFAHKVREMSMSKWLGIDNETYLVLTFVD
jgi:hypothetical protein